MMDRSDMAVSIQLSMLALCIVATSAIPSYFYPVEHRSIEPSIAVLPETSQYEYRLVPNNGYAVAEYYNPADLTIWDILPRIKTAVSIVVVKAWAVTKWVVAKGSLVLLGAALLLGFCAFTPFCTISFQKHSFLGHQYRAIMESSAISQIEDFVYTAIDKFKSLQDVNAD